MKAVPDHLLNEWLMGDKQHPANVEIVGWSWRQARAEFMHRYMELT